MTRCLKNGGSIDIESSIRNHFILFDLPRNFNWSNIRG